MKILLFVDFLFVTVFPEQEAPCVVCHVRNQSIDSLYASLCYQYNWFHPQQLHILHDKLNLHPIFIIHQGRARCSSEEAFFVTVV